MSTEEIRNIINLIETYSTTDREITSFARNVPELKQLIHTPIKESISLRTKNIINSVRDFLEPRFPDNRYEGDYESEGMPKSFFNCFPAAIFLAHILNQTDPTSGWIPVHGKYFADSHAFVIDKSGTFVADVTGDQFGEFEAILIPLNGSEYEVREQIQIDQKPVTNGDRRLLSRWISEWNLLS